MEQKESNIQSYQDYLRLSNYSNRTIEMYLRTIRTYHTYLTSQSVELDGDQEQARKFLLYRLGQGKSWSTINCEINYADTYPDLKAAIFMSSGEKEEAFAENVKKLTEILRSRNYENLKLNTVIFEGEGHITCFPAAISRGLTELFTVE